MKKIKLIAGDGLGALQKNIDKWINDTKPYIDSISPIPISGAFSNTFTIAILYSESPLE